MRSATLTDQELCFLSVCLVHECAFLDSQPHSLEPTLPSTSQGHFHPLPDPPQSPDPLDGDDSRNASDGDEEPDRPWSPLTSSSAPRGQSTSDIAPPDSNCDKLDPGKLLHPRSEEWTPATKVASHIAGRLRTPLDKEAHGRPRVQWALPSLDSKVALMPEINAKMATLLA
ncbi:hypothetical protein NDU88_012971 [Pleurodeles waltl]|uniref:Uncharacterized protein n=1 Tax=Pleurodeles waltl TaxID=8319 RepID=A0AAV7R321_PLEWA|nr:hypothetical protein NDU88_012971 [Pleurodeles waltl]